MTIPLAGSSTGRPREFDGDVALQAALVVFWQKGYAATSLDDLTAAMGLSRSSFYGAFSSKHDLLLASVKRYVDGIYASLEAAAAAQPDALAAVRAIVESVADPRGGKQGCLLVNSIAELAPGDEAICVLARMQIDRVVKLLGTLLVRAGYQTDAVDDLAGALLSCAFGAATLRKAGVPSDAVAGVIQQANCLLTKAAI